MNIWHYVKRRWGLAILVLAVDVIGSACTTLFGLGSANIITSVADRNVQLALFWFIILGLTSLVWGLQIFFHEKMLATVIQTMDSDIRADIVTVLSGTDYSTFHQENTSTYVSWLTNDIATINDYGFECLEMAVSQAITIIMSIATIVTFHYSLIITIAVLMIIMYLVPKLFTKQMNQVSLAATKQAEKTTKIFADFLNGFDDLFLVNLQRTITAKVREAAESLADTKVKQASAMGRMQAASNVTSLLSQVGLMGQSCLLFLMRVVPIGAISAARYFSATIFANTTGMLANWSEIKTVQPVFDKYTGITSQEMPVDTLVEYSTQSPAEISFEGVSFAFGEHQVLQESTFVLNSHRKYALIGESGAGKSTILKLMAKILVPTAGTIRLGGLSYGNLSGEGVRKRIALVGQNPHIFNESLRFNLTLGALNTDQEMQSAIDQSGLQPLIEQLENGLDTVLLEDGINLSGGQKQRIALARGLLQGKDIWLLDEAISSLDPAARLDVEARLLQIPEVTVLIVTHHLTDKLSRQLDAVFELRACQVLKRKQ